MAGIVAGLALACGLSVTGTDSGVASGDGGGVAADGARLDPDGGVGQGTGKGGGGGELPDEPMVVIEAGSPEQPGAPVDVDAALPPAEDAATPGCAGTRGPTMVNMGTYCIDSTEVTQAQYQQFLAEVQNGPAANLPPYCEWKANHLIPGGSTCRWSPTTNANFPVTCVDWCDAYAYCRWAGKRLCGKIGGGGMPYSSATDDATQDQWYRACSNAGAQAYPYGNTYDPARCNGQERTGSGPVNVGTLAQCVGGAPGLFDMSGNVYEIEDACDGTTGARDRCKLRGGSWYYSSAQMRCTGFYPAERSTRYDATGFRCCSP